MLVRGVHGTKDHPRASSQRYDNILKCVLKGIVMVEGTTSTITISTILQITIIVLIYILYVGGTSRTEYASSTYDSFRA